MELPIVKKLRQEVDELRYELQVKIPKDLQEAAAQGDLSENAEYESARARQDFVRVRVAQLEERLRQLVLYDFSSIPRDRIAYVYLMSRHLEFGIRFVDAVPGGQQAR